MTIKELEEFLVRERDFAASKLGYNMCGKYARCLFCAQSDQYPCASAHERMEVAVRSASVALPAWLLPEPPFYGVRPSAVPTPAPVAPSVPVQPVRAERTVARTAERRPEPVRAVEPAAPQPQFPQEEPSAPPVSNVRAQGGVVVRARSYDAVPLLKIRKK